MKIHVSKWRTPSFTILTGTLSLLALMSTPVAHAESGYVGIWNGIYPGSSAADDAGCQLCHADSNRELNPYGEALCSSGAGSISSRILAVESVNSDADPTGSGNFTEIDASTQPGWTPGIVNLTYNRGDCSATGNVESPPFGPDPGFLMDPVAGNQPPLADANGPYSGTVDIPLTLDGTASSDPDGTIVSFDWNYGDGTTGTGDSPTHTYLSDGTFTVMLTVTDDMGDTGTAGSTAIIGLGNQPPVADANVPYSGTVGETVTFDGTGSSDPDGRIASYSWDFGDGNSGTGPSPTHTYTSAGMFNVTLTVTDDASATDSAATTAAITEQPVNQLPVANPNGPYSGTAGDAITFDGSGSSDPDGTIVAYSWDFGDGNTGSGATPTHTYSSDGNYSVTLTVADDAADTGTAMTTASIGAGNLPPVASPGGPYSGTVGVPAAFDGSASSDPDGTIVAYSWDFGDGTNGTGPSPDHSYGIEGTYNVTLEVTDDTGVSDSAMMTATITPVATGADVFLTRLKVPGRVKGRQGNTTSQRVMAIGDGDTLARDATVSLTVLSPAGVTVAVNPASSTQMVSPEDDATRYRFNAGITCDAPGTYVLEWTATIAAAENSDPGNDTLADTTSVRCKGQRTRALADKEDEVDDDEEDEEEDEDEEDEDEEDEDEEDEEDEADESSDESDD